MIKSFNLLVQELIMPDTSTLSWSVTDTVSSKRRTKKTCIFSSGIDNCLSYFVSKCNRTSLFWRRGGKRRTNNCLSSFACEFHFAMFVLKMKKNKKEADNCLSFCPKSYNSNPVCSKGKIFCISRRDKRQQSKWKI